MLAKALLNLSNRYYSGVTKKVKTETGLEVFCPQFVKVGDTIRVNTETGDYVTRV